MSKYREWKSSLFKFIIIYIILKTDLAQTWFTYGKPVMADNRQTRSCPDLVHIRQAGASREPALPELSRIRAGPAGYLGDLSPYSSGGGRPYSPTSAVRGGPAAPD